MTMGALAAETRCTVSTIRYYEDIGLLPRASRRMGGHRVYGEADLRRVAFILAQRQLGEVRGKLKELRVLERGLKKFVNDCTAQCAGGPARACVILEDLAGSQPSPCCGSSARAGNSA